MQNQGIADQDHHLLESLKSIFSSFIGTSPPHVKRQVFRYCVFIALSLALVRSFAVPSVDVADFRRFDLLCRRLFVHDVMGWRQTTETMLAFEKQLESLMHPASPTQTVNA